MATALQIKETENQGLKRAFEVIVPAATLETEVTKQLEAYGKKAKIPGFRPGKIPAQVLRQKYGQSVMGEVLQNAVNDATREVLETQKLVPAMQPNVEVTQFEEGGDLSFKMQLELMPDAPTIDFASIKLDKPTYAPSDEEINQALERIAGGNRSLKPKDGASAAKGDVVKIDFKGFLGDEAFEGGEAKGHDLEIGSGQFIPGFEEQLIGASAGQDVTVTVPFPGDYHKADLAGKEARFEVKVHAVQEAVSPEIDDAFAKQLGLESLDKLKDAVREQIQKDYDSLARNRMKKQLFDQLDAKCDFEVPEGMRKLEFGSIWQQVEAARTQGDPTLKDKSDEDLKKEYEAIALRRVRLGILLSQTAGKNDLSVNQQDLQRAMIEQARSYPGQERQIFEFYQKNPEHLAELRGPILEEKAVDFILGKVNLNETPLSLDALIAEQSETTGGLSTAAHAHDHGDHGHEHGPDCNH